MRSAFIAAVRDGYSPPRLGETKEIGRMAKKASSTTTRTRPASSRSSGSAKSQPASAAARTRNSSTGARAATSSASAPETGKRGVRAKVKRAEPTGEETNRSARPRTQSQAASTTHRKSEPSRAEHEGARVARRAAQLDAAAPAGFGRTISEFASAHAAPLTLFSAGVGWLMVALTRKAKTQNADGPASHDQRYLGEQAVEQFRARAEQVAEQAAHAGEQIAQKTQQVGETVGRTGRRAVELADEHPLATGLLVLAAGAAAAALLPATSPENKWLGAPRDRLIKQAKRSLDGIKDKALERTEELREALADLSRAAE